MRPSRRRPATCRARRLRCRASRTSSPSSRSACRRRWRRSGPRKETIKSAYTAAEAETRVREAVTGISEEMGDVGMAIQRAQDKTEQMQARAGALGELLASGALEDATLPGGRDDLQSQLDALTAGHDVDHELARMKA